MAQGEGEWALKRVDGFIGELMRQTGKSRRDLLVLSDHSDPFYAGTPPAQRKGAEWFAKMWESEYVGQTGIHIRRCHYHIDATGFPKINRMPYTNITRDWYMLLETSKWARILRLVPADAFEDHRNPDPYELNWRMADEREPTIFGLNQQYDWSLPSLSSCDWSLDTPGVDGYSPDDYLDRAYLLEVWIEKSTMDDILVPLTKELGVRLVPSTGFQSISNAIKLCKRVREIGKPARVFYISDWDKPGRGMPIAVARHFEFWRKYYCPKADVELKVLALTREQIDRYGLPSSVDNRNAVELDALEALAPGELENIVRRAIEPYLDRNIDAQLAAAKRRAQAIVQQKWSRLIAPHRRTLAVLQQSVEEIREQHRKSLERALRPFEKPLAQLQAEVERAAANFHPDLPARPAQEVSEQNERDCLFDSERSYLEQLPYYKAAQKAK
jgi:hypothetical protein